MSVYLLLGGEYPSEDCCIWRRSHAYTGRYERGICLTYLGILLALPAAQSLRRFERAYRVLFRNLVP